MGIESRRFLYATRVGANGVETLRLGELLPPPVRRGARKAREVRSVTTVPGSSGAQEVPESWQTLVPSPGNRHIAALAEQMSLDFVDHNLKIVDMVGGTVAASFNEHRFSTIGRATWPSALFDAYLAAEAEIGVPPEDLAGYDWSVDMEGAAGANIPFPEIRWADDQILVVSFKLLVVTNTGTELGEEWFRFRLSAADGFAAYTPWTGAVPAAPPPSKLSLAPPGAKNAGTILYKGVPLEFVRRGFLWLPVLLLSKWRRAILVGGLVE